LLDLDVGQHRTGLPAGPEAVTLYRAIASSPNLTPGGLHAYDGPYLGCRSRNRKAACNAAFAPVAKLRYELQSAGLRVPRVVAVVRQPSLSRTPPGRRMQSGTTVFWDSGYGNKLRDLDFLPAALVLTRVVSSPVRTASASTWVQSARLRNAAPTLQFLNLPDYNALTHSEENLVIETANADQFKIGDCLFGVPRHICPTVALYSSATALRTMKLSVRGRSQRVNGA